MLKVLIKKQLAEVFKSYFFDAKKNKMRSKAAVAGWFVFFAVVMVGFLGGLFSFLAFSICGSFVAAGMGWMYFLMLGGIAIVLGAFGSVFNTYSGLYLAKDNDLMLSLPIPVRYIMASRLINVYLMGTLYSATVFIPTLIVYWIVAGITASRVVCGIIMFLAISIIVMILSCLLGWVVAKVSLKLKNKSFISVIIALVFFGAYYFLYFKANGFIRELIMNAETYAERIKGAAYALFLFGRMGEGAWIPTLITFAAALAVFALVWYLMSRSFISIATDAGKTEKVKYVEKTARQKSVFGAFLGKEFGRFTKSPSYMLNCGLGVLLLPAGGVLMLIKGAQVCETIEKVFETKPGSAAAFVCAVLCMVAAMNDMAAPSVSLEGKSIWIPQSLPINPGTALRAKAALQIILTGIPMFFAAVCTALVVNASVAVKLLICVLSLSYVLFSAFCETAINLKMPVMSWTSEIAPIKQSGAVMLSLFGGWAVSLALCGIYLLVGYKLGAALYLSIWTVLFLVGSLVVLRWLDKTGSRIFANL